MELGVGRENERGCLEEIFEVPANESTETEKPSRARIQTECDVVCGRGRSDIRFVEGWERDSGTEVRLPTNLAIYILSLNEGSLS
jgi:hypothetical protein